MAHGNLHHHALASTTVAFHAIFENRSDAHVRGGVTIHYRNDGSDASITPDLFVVVGDVDVPEVSYKAWEEGANPDFALDVMRPSTTLEDVRAARATCERLGIREYWAFDPSGRLLEPEYGRRVVGYKLRLDSTYKEIPATDDGNSYSSALFLQIKEVEGHLSIYDTVAEQLFWNYYRERARRQHLEGLVEKAYKQSLKTVKSTTAIMRVTKLACIATEAAAKALKKSKAENERLRAKLQELSPKWVV